MFALKLHDTRFNTSFRAVKTVFCFDDVLVCLGSDIENDDGGHATVTPLFQAAISEDRSTEVNGASVGAIPYAFSGTNGAEGMAYGFIWAMGMWFQMEASCGCSVRCKFLKIMAEIAAVQGLLNWRIWITGALCLRVRHITMPCWFRGRRIG